MLTNITLELLHVFRPLLWSNTDFSNRGVKGCLHSAGSRIAIYQKRESISYLISNRERMRNSSVILLDLIAQKRALL